MAWRFPPYSGPFNSPAFWRDETSGVLRDAIKAYLERCETPEQLALTIRYCAYWVDAPCWQGDGMLLLRQRIHQVRTRDALDRWLWDALGEGIDPL